ncbi:PAP2 superfamily protein [Micromonospora pattaloongensis]|uniref:PAP2 superfamily protein n=2 Tax=Micromonospora pattaloongensis TaxID=405436 RepID=A0A1H3SUI9_9ACTN|nr:PAP2 superfamily protein [Micromonospora pattaloongensis]
MAAVLLLLAAVHVAVFIQVWWFFVHTRRGQQLDTLGLAGNSIGRDRVDGITDTVLNAMSVASLAIATAVIVFIALIRRRIMLALMAALLVLGANLTTQLVKYLTVRPDLGIDPERAGAGNSLPSGHTAVAASVAVALVLVVPARVRGLAAVLGAAYAAVAGVATLSAGWHRPSDAVASLLMVGAWAAFAGFVLVLTQPASAEMEPGAGHRLAVTLLALAGVLLLAAAAVALTVNEPVSAIPPEELSRRRLSVAYGGGAAAIAGTAALVMALVLAPVHRVVLRRTG